LKSSGKGNDYNVKNKMVISTRIINDTLSSGLIKVANPENQSKKYASYTPFYA
jgi:hypothetical protein